MELGAADLRDAAALLTDEDFAAELLKLAALLDNVSLALTIAGEPRDSLEALEAALALADQLVDRLPDDDQGDARVVISLIRSGLRRAKAYAEEAPALPLD